MIANESEILFEDLVFSSRKITYLPTMQKPIMSEAVEHDVNNVLVQYTKRDLWLYWGMPSLREQGTAALLLGPPGTGKTTIAKYIAYKVGRGFKQLSVSELASEGSPGEFEKQIKVFFEDCKKRKNATIFIDECDHLLLSRESLGEAGRTWQLGGVEQLMMCMNQYRGLILAASNHPSMMDAAVSDRWFAIIHVRPPDYDGRRRLWMQKLPKQFPFQFNPEQLKLISKHPLTGRQIETVILSVASNAIRLNKKPSFDMFETFAIRERSKQLKL